MGKEPVLRTNDRNDRSPLLLLLLMMAAGFLLRFHRIDAESFWLDEVYSWHLASNDLLSIVRGSVGDRHTPPLYYALLHCWMLLGRSDLFLRLFSALLGLFCIPLFYSLGRLVADRKTGLFAAFVATAAPFLVYYGQEARGYTLLLLLVLTGSIFLWRYIEEGKLRYGFLFALVSILALYTHYYAGFSLIAMNGFALWELRRRRVNLVWWVVLQVVIVAAFLPWVVNLLTAGFGGGQGFRRFLFSQVPYTFLRFNVGYGMLPLTPEAKADMLLFVRGNILLIAAVYLSFGAVFLRGVIRSARSGRVFRFLVCNLSIPFLLAILVSLRSNLISERYLLVTFPFFAILLVEGVRGRMAWPARLATAGCVVLLVTALAAHYWNEDAGKTEWRDAAELVAVGEIEGDVILVAPGYLELPFRHYYGGAAPVIGLRTEEDFDMAEFERDLCSLDGAGRFWLVISHTTTPEFYSGLLEERGRETYSVRFRKENGIRVILYEAALRDSS